MWSAHWGRRAEVPIGVGGAAQEVGAAHVVGRLGSWGRRMCMPAGFVAGAALAMDVETDDKRVSGACALAPLGGSFVAHHSVDGGVEWSHSEVGHSEHDLSSSC